MDDLPEPVWPLRPWTRTYPLSAISRACLAFCSTIRTGRPVRLEFTRVEELVAAVQRRVLERRLRLDLSVFDGRGRRVRRLDAGIRDAGRHEVVWNGRDDTGRQVASGTYFYRLEAGSYSETKRMVLLK